MNNSIQSEKVSAEAAGDALVQLAYDTTPAKHHHHIVVLTQNKRIGGKGSNVWASVKAPYMSVAGRTSLAREQHQAAGARMDVSTEFVQIADKWVCKATVTSSMHGTTVGHAVAEFGANGIAGNCPLETSETSAIGRALGFQGFGIFAGIASSDEVEHAIGKSSPPVTNPVEKIPQSNDSPVDQEDVASGYEVKRKALCAQLRQIATDRGLTATLARQRELVRTQETPVSNEQLEGLVLKFSTMTVQHVPSRSDENVVHEVVTHKNGKMSCSCDAHYYRGSCAHIDSVTTAAAA